MGGPSIGPEQGPKGKDKKFKAPETGADWHDSSNYLANSRRERENYLKEITPASTQEIASAASELGLANENLAGLGVEADPNLIEQKRKETEEILQRTKEKTDQVLTNLLKMASESKFGSNQYPSDPKFKEGIMVEDPGVFALIMARTHAVRLGDKQRPKIFNLGGEERYFEVREQTVMNNDLRHPYTKERKKSWTVSLMDKPEEEYDPLRMSPEELDRQDREERGL